MPPRSTGSGRQHRARPRSRPSAPAHAAPAVAPPPPESRPLPRLRAAVERALAPGTGRRLPAAHRGSARTGHRSARGRRVRRGAGRPGARGRARCWRRVATMLDDVCPTPCASKATPTRPRSAPRRYASNWELSTARATRVVEFLVDDRRAVAGAAVGGRLCGVQAARPANDSAAGPAPQPARGPGPAATTPDGARRGTRREVAAMRCPFSPAELERAARPAAASAARAPPTASATPAAGCSSPAPAARWARSCRASLPTAVPTC